MKKEIAVFLDENGHTSSMDKVGTVKVFSKQFGEWKVIKEISLNISKANSVRNNIKMLAELIKKLDKCQVFVGRKIEGLPHTALSMTGIRIIEISGNPKGFLDEVLRNTEKEQNLTGISNKVSSHSKNYCDYIKAKQLNNKSIMSSFSRIALSKDLQQQI